MARWSSRFYLFEYTTIKYVVTQNKKVGLLYRIFQLIVMGYLIGWVFVTKKEYQAKDDTIESSVLTKVKGVALVNTTDSKFWAPEDYVMPKQGEDFIFIITNFIETANQKLGNCSEDHSIPDAKCTKHEDCREGEAVRAGNGIKTGICLKPDEHSNGTCEINGWCPIEKSQEANRDTAIRQAENFTLYTRNFIRFSQFNFSKSNVLNTSNKSYLKSCLYDQITNPYCPIFRLGDIVDKAGCNFQETAVKGGSFAVMIEWSCDLDKGESNCHPQYSFLSLGSNASFTSGYNLRFARYNDNAGQKQRTLIKAFGIHLDIIVFGTARKFNIIKTIINIASVLTLMTAGSFLCDIILLCLMKKSTVYRDSKFERMRKNDKESPGKKRPEGLKRKFSL